MWEGHYSKDGEYHKIRPIEKNTAAIRDIKERDRKESALREERAKAERRQEQLNNRQRNNYEEKKYWDSEILFNHLREKDQENQGRSR